MKNKSIGVLGLGKLGLPLSIMFCDAGNKVFGLDSDKKVSQGLKGGMSHIYHVSDSKIEKHIDSNFFIVDDYSELSSCQVIVICLPTGLIDDKAPSCEKIISALHKLCPYLERGVLISIESLSYPDFVYSVKDAISTHKGWEIGTDFYCGYASNRVRINPNEIAPKIVGGVTPECLNVINTFYKSFYDNVLMVDDVRVASIVKLYESTYRFVNISLVNELMIICDSMGVDMKEVIKAASLQEYGFIPGIGSGGDSVPVAPYFLTSKTSSRFCQEPSLIDQSKFINEEIIEFWVKRIISQMEMIEFDNDGVILVLGITYKKNINDISNSPAIKIIKSLFKKYGDRVMYHDPYVPHINIDNNIDFYAIKDYKEFVSRDNVFVIILIDHDFYDWGFIKKQSAQYLDARFVV